MTSSGTDGIEPAAPAVMRPGATRNRSQDDQIRPDPRPGYSADTEEDPAVSDTTPPQPRGAGFKRFGRYFRKGGKLQPFRLLKTDFSNIRHRYFSDWTVFNQLVIASTVYVFFTNLLPGITFAGDLYVLTGRAWGTIEVVFSTGLCGIIFAL